MRVYVCVVVQGCTLYRSGGRKACMCVCVVVQGARCPAGARIQHRAH